MPVTGVVHLSKKSKTLGVFSPRIQRLLERVPVSELPVRLAEEMSGAPVVQGGNGKNAVSQSLRPQRKQNRMATSNLQTRVNTHIAALTQIMTDLDSDLVPLTASDKAGIQNSVLLLKSAISKINDIINVHEQTRTE